MVNFTIDQVRKMMSKLHNIRNISVIAHVDHGKSTLTDSLIGKAGIIAESREGDARFMDTRDDEQARSITIKATSVSLYYERKEDEFDRAAREKAEKEHQKAVKEAEEKGEVLEEKKEAKEEVTEEKDGSNTTSYLINLIDSPGHVDFSSEVTAALRVTDGALVVVDCIEGVCVQTETVLRQAISERIRPVLFLNKLDRIFLELSPTLEECYRNFRDSIESVNVICSTYQDEKLGNCECRPEVGKVGFGSGLHAWGFTLSDFAKMYSGKFAISVSKMMKKLWGENFWNNKKHCWQRTAEDDKHQRSFNIFVLKPIRVMFDAIMTEKREIYEPLVKALNLTLPKKELKLAINRQKDLLKLIMRTWLPAGNALLDMICTHLPSPVEAQAYRVDNLYSGPLDSEPADYIRRCDQHGPVSMYVSKMVPTSEKGRFVAFGRVFSGTVKTGEPIRILGPEYTMGGKKDLFLKKIQRTMLMMGRYTEQIPDCPAGNVCGLVGIDQFLVKSGTLTSSDQFYPFHTMKFSVAAVVQVAVEPKNAADLPKLVEGLKRLSKSDPLVKTSISKSGQHIIAGAGELHLEICLKDLREQYLKGAEITVSKPVVSFAETVIATTGQDDRFPAMAVSKSPNKHNRLYVTAEPLEEDFVIAAEDQEITLTMDNKKLTKHIMKEFKWDKSEAQKIWTFGCPPDALGNCVVDVTKGVQFLNEIKDHVIGAFMGVSNYGVLAEEMLRGCRFNIHDVKLHADAIHRGAGQIMPCARRVFYAAQIMSKPRILEPVFKVNISVPVSSQSGVFTTLASRRGETTKIENRVGTPLSNLTAHLPVLESFGFTELLRKNTGGKAFPQMQFSHWQLISGDPFDEDSMGYKIVMENRERKGIKVEMPKWKDYFDRIN